MKQLKQVRLAVSAMLLAMVVAVAPFVAVIPAAPAFADKTAGWHDIHHAVKNGDNKLLREILCADKKCPALLGAKSGDKKALEAVAKILAKREAKTPKGETPLHIAVLHNNNAAIEILVKAGADVNANDNNKWTPLHYAAAEGKLDAVNAFIKAGADLNAKINIGWTPLHAAIGIGKGQTAAVILALAKAGANKDARDKKNLTPLELAERKNNLGAAAALVAEGALDHHNKYDNSQQTLLHVAAREFSPFMVRAIIKTGAEVDAKDYKRWTPLLHAVVKNRVDVVRILIDAHANPMHQTGSQIDSYKTPLAAARLVASQHGGEIVKVLEAALKRGDVRDQHGWAELHRAVKNGDAVQVRKFIRNGTNLNVQTNWGESPLHFAAWYQPDIVKMLVKGGANVDVKDRNNWTPLHYAASEDNYNAVAALIDGGANVNAQSNVGWTPLHAAVANRKGDHNTDFDWRTKQWVFKVLVEAGADLKLKTTHWPRTPADMAVEARGWSDKVTGYLYRETYCKPGMREDSKPC